MECLAKMVFTALIFFWGGWQFRASKMEKKLLRSFEGFENSLSQMDSNFNKELEFHRVERDNLMLQQQEVLSKLQELNTKQIKEQDEKIIDTSSNESNNKLNAIKNKNNGIKK